MLEELKKLSIDEQLNLIINDQNFKKIMLSPDFNFEFIEELFYKIPEEKQKELENFISIELPKMLLEDENFLETMINKNIEIVYNLIYKSIPDTNKLKSEILKEYIEKELKQKIQLGEMELFNLINEQSSEQLKEQLNTWTEEYTKKIIYETDQYTLESLIAYFHDKNVNLGEIINNNFTNLIINDETFYEYASNKFTDIIDRNIEKIINVNPDFFININEKLTDKLIEEKKFKILNYVPQKLVNKYDKEIKSKIEEQFKKANKTNLDLLGYQKYINNNIDYVNLFLEKEYYEILNYAPKNVMEAIPEDTLKKAIKNGYIINENMPDKLKNDKEFIVYSIKNNQPNIIDYVNEELLMSNKEIIDLALKNGYIINENSSKVVLSKQYIKYAIDNKQPEIIEYATEELLENNIDLIVDAYINGYNKLGILLTFKNTEKLPEELRKTKENLMNLLEKYGKINALEKNPVLSYEFVKYIYPLLGEDLSLDLLKYNTGASEIIINEIKKGNTNIIVNYYNKICSQIYNGSDKTIHYAFRYFDKYEELVRDIFEKGYKLTEEDILNLKKIINTANRYDIKTIEELKQYKKIVEKRLDDIMNYNNLNDIKEILSQNFGFLGFENTDSSITQKYTMKDIFTNFQIDNFHKINFIIQSIKNSKMVNPEKYILTEHEKKIILLMKEIIETENIQVLKELIRINISDNKELIDYSEDVERIINKIRNLYNLQFQTKLTDINKLESKKTQYSKTINVYDNEKDKIGHKKEITYEIIDMDSEKFNFLAHRIFNYDPKMSEFYEMLIRNPQLWTKLDGASTLSTSSISDKGFWMISHEDNSGIIYLFNNLEEDFMLFMYGRDLMVEHGGHKLEPTSTANYFTDIDGLNQASVYRPWEYNEVAGFRKNMMPCAIACVGEEPNEEQIRAAAYFNIPIIRFNQKAYSDKRIKEYTEAKENIKTNPSLETIESIFLSGDIKEYDEQLEKKYDYCFNILKEKYMNKEITQEEFIQKISYIQSLLDRICDDQNENRKLIKKSELFIETFCAMQNITEEELIKIETANMGESGIMFKSEEQGKEYLLKPAVDKQELKTQNFRAEIQKSASILQQLISEDTAVKVDVIGNDIKISKQEKIELSNNPKLLNDWVNGRIKLEKHYSDQLLQEYVVDFLLCNFDCFDGNFIIDKNDNIRGIDKEQSFRFIDNPESLNPDFSYVPNGISRIPIYKTLFEKYKKGEIELDFNAFDETIAKVEAISDEQYKNIFRKYAEGVNPINPEQILNKILERKHQCTEIMVNYIESLKELQKGEHKL